MTNRLAATTSPYLLQHSNNPVDWYPWGEEALSRARSENRPILLSVGYSACHWCHVMERESFEDPETAALMNEHFVNVKVDREERPDVDQVYMRAVQSMTGHGGWPLTAFLTPTGEPYYGGTYFPPEPRHGMPSFRQILTAAAAAYRERPDEVRQAADRMVGALRAASELGSDGGAPGDPPDEALLDRACEGLSRRYDSAHGGFGSAPKFPQPTTLEAVLRHHLRTGDPHSLEMVLRTLRKMADGGIRDHLGGGFHRYSVDAKWLVPHFEKMLYDNALLARIYVDAWKVSGAEDLRRVAESTLDYVLADLTAPEGGFYSARDADSEGEEGTFYVWTPSEVESVLGDRSATFMDVYDVTTAGNFEGRNILHLDESVEAFARRNGHNPADLVIQLDQDRRALFDARSAREAPFRDEKILVAWNGMTVRSLAEAGAALGRSDYVDAATRAATFILSRMRENGRLFRVHAAGRSHGPAFLEDYAALGNALLSLHEATLDTRLLPEVTWACDATIRHFFDRDAHSFWDSAHDGEALVVRPRDTMDNATPSGNSLAAELLARAGHLFDNSEYREVAAAAVAGEVANLSRFPSAFGRLQAVADRMAAAPTEVVVVGAPDDAQTTALHRVVARAPHRNLTLTGYDPGAGDAPPMPLTEGKEMVGGQPAAYVCRGFSCRRPVTTPGDLEAEMADPPAG